MHATMKAAQVIASWKPAPKAAAEKMIEKFPIPRKDAMHQAVNYNVDPTKADASP